MIFAVAYLVYEAGAYAGDKLMEELSERVAKGVTKGLTDFATDSLPSIGASMLSALTKSVTPDAIVSALGMSDVRDALSTEMNNMGVSLVATAELEALRALANAAAGQGDLKAALDALIAVKKSG